MKQTTKLTLPNGRAVYVEAEAPASSGAQDLSTKSPGTIAEKAFDIVSSTLAGIAADIEQHLNEFGARGPQKVMVEINAEIRAGGAIYIFNGGAQGGIKVQLTWERKD